MELLLFLFISGDIEVLLDLDSYLQTSLCTQRTEVLVLEMKHYERLLIKRNPRTIEAMKGDLELRLKSRINKHLEKSVPVLKNLFAKAEEYNVQRQQQVEARHNAGQEKHSKHPKTMGETFDSFVPPQGALIDMYGPGTVFYRIRQREAAKIKKQERLRNKNAYSGFHSLSGAALSNPADESRAIDAHALGGALNNFGSGLQQVDPLTSDPVLSNLEERMKTWLANEYSAQNPNSIANSKAQPRIAKLHRGSADVRHSAFLLGYDLLYGKPFVYFNFILGLNSILYYTHTYVLHIRVFLYLVITGFCRDHD